MEERTRSILSEDRKRLLSRWLREWRPLRAALRVAARLAAPRQPIGAIGVVFDEEGRVLLVEHLFRTDYPWGLPGGWVRRGEAPSDAVRRELREELGLDVDVGSLLLAEPIGLVTRSTHPPHFGVAYTCRVVAGACRPALEVIGFEWVAPDEIHREIAPFQRLAVERAAARSPHRGTTTGGPTSTASGASATGSAAG